MSNEDGEKRNNIDTKSNNDQEIKTQEESISSETLNEEDNANNEEQIHDETIDTDSNANTEMITNDSIANAKEKVSPLIKDISWGSVEIVGFDEPFKDVILYPGHAKEWDWNKNGTRHQPGIVRKDVEELISHNCDVIILSSGMEKRLNTSKETLELLDQREMEENKDYYILQSLEAVKLYNRLLKSKKRVGALIHSTC